MTQQAEYVTVVLAYCFATSYKTSLQILLILQFNELGLSHHEHAQSTLPKLSFVISCHFQRIKMVMRPLHLATTSSEAVQPSSK